MNNETIHLCENGLVIHLEQGEYHIRRYDPNETMDSKWDILLRDNLEWGSAACFGLNTGFDDLGSAIKVAETIILTKKIPKGGFLGECNRTVCDNIARFQHIDNLQYYCVECARMINEVNGQELIPFSKS